MSLLTSAVRDLMSSSSTDRPAVLRNTFGLFDRDHDGAIATEEFASVFARAAQEAGGGLDGYPPVSSFPVERSVFEVAAVPSFSRARSVGLYQAVRMMAELDVDRGGSVTAADLVPRAPLPPDMPEGDPEPPTPPQLDAGARADELLARYDRDGKGWIDLADIAQAWTDDPSLGDPAAAAAAIEAWDRDGDGLVARDELVTGFEQMDLADALLAVLAPEGTGAIDLSTLSDEALDAVGIERTRLAGWDFDGDGLVGRTEILQGLKTKTAAADDPAALAAALMARHDADGSAGLDAQEFAAMAAADGSAVGAEAFAAWDENGDGSVSVTELTSGIELVSRARTIVSDYDLANKGWFDEADIKAALEASGDTQTDAAGIVGWWDVDGDGRVTVSEVVSGIQAGGYVAGKQVAEETGTTTA